MLIEAKKYPEAEARLQGLARSVPADDPQALRVQAYLAECQAASDSASGWEGSARGLLLVFRLQLREQFLEVLPRVQRFEVALLSQLRRVPEAARAGAPLGQVQAGARRQSS